MLDDPHAWELIVEARREDFAHLTTTELLEVVGLSKERVEQLMAEVDRTSNPPSDRPACQPRAYSYGTASPDVGKFILVLRHEPGKPRRILADMDNGNSAR